MAINQENLKKIQAAVATSLHEHWGLFLSEGIIDLILGAFIFLGLPGTATWILGLVVGVNMLFGGK
jgi:uncharacterized membrane protein HdeD (DUF308 family)